MYQYEVVLTVAIDEHDENSDSIPYRVAGQTDGNPFRMVREAKRAIVRQLEECDFLKAAWDSSTSLEPGFILRVCASAAGLNATYSAKGSATSQPRAAVRAAAESLLADAWNWAYDLEDNFRKAAV